ncbi:MAG: acyl carrier protein [Alphaproteobacteria bacterium]|nr:acyl carrier protein [Alphaproteobacteria bacterium]
MNDFLNNFWSLLDETEQDLIVANTVFKELEEWSSIVALSLIAMVDEEYDVTLETDDIRNSSTLEELYNTIQSKK